MGETGIPGRPYSPVPRSKYLVVVAAAALFLSVVELADLFQLPLEGSISGAASTGSLVSMSFLTSLLNTGYAGLFVLMAMESAALPIPSEVVLPFAGYLVYLGKMNLEMAFAVATAAGLVGALVDYYLALWLGRPLVYGLLRRVGVAQSHLDSAERWVDSKGAWSVFVGRFIPGVRSVISLPAGVLRMKLAPFVVLTIAGSFIWSAVLIYLGFQAGPLWQSALGSLSGYATQAALIVVAAASVLYIAFYFGQLGRKG